jgi:4-amino-4-deoxy-L-arabinose transferase-like glycosyltransferase
MFRGRFRVLWLGLVAAALTIRLAFAFWMPLEVPWPDGREYMAVGQSLLEQGSYGTQTLRAPGYPTFIALVAATLGSDLRTLRVVEAVLGTLTVALIGVIGAGVFGAAAGMLAMGMAAIHPVLAFLPSTQYSESFMVFVVVAGFGAAFAAWRRETIGMWILAGALFGVAMLIRPNVLMLLPGLVLGFVLASLRGIGHRVATALLFTVAAVVVVTPWTIRNHAVHHHWFFVATGGGRQFWYGNNPEASAATTTVTSPDSAMSAELWRLPDDIEREHYLYRRGIEFVRAHPGRAAWLYLVKLGNLFALYPETYSRTQFMNMGTRISMGLASIVIYVGTLLALRRIRERPALWPLVGSVVSFAVTNAVFFTVMRYRMAFEPCLLWLAGVGWADVWRARREVSR